MLEMCFFCEHQWLTRYRAERRCPKCNRQDWHIAYYGAVAIQRAYCPVCKSWTLVVDGRTSCCATRLETHEELGQHRETEARNERRVPTKRDQSLILDAQQNRCYYCDAEFDGEHTRVTWDHVVPFSYCGNNHRDNFVAACQVCNNLKADRLLPESTVFDKRELRILARELRKKSFGK